jgi:hypothetical protein
MAWQFGHTDLLRGGVSMAIACEAVLAFANLSDDKGSEYHVASGIVNANHGIMLAAEELRVVDCIPDSVRLAVRQPTKASASLIRSKPRLSLRGRTS